MAAALHDMRHPGTNNNYQVNRMTEWRMIYNDNSVLENLRASRASYLLVGLEEGGQRGSQRRGRRRPGDHDEGAAQDHLD